ncbi:MAG: hypothetical protein M1827_004522 [Pycnora praestabilis]|nr:MAG: hypothetical protein M1827_004522 [Pycnora praestabilis]
MAANPPVLNDPLLIDENGRGLPHLFGQRRQAIRARQTNPLPRRQGIGIVMNTRRKSGQENTDKRSPQLRIGSHSNLPLSAPEHSPGSDDSSFSTSPISPTTSSWLSGNLVGNHTGWDDRFPSYAVNHSQPPTSQRPLIDLVKNEWRHNPKFGQTYSPPSGIEEPSWLAMLKAPRLRRYVAVYVVLLCTVWISYKLWLVPRWAEQSVLSHSLDDRPAKGWFGANITPMFTDMIHLRTLDSRLLPQTGTSASNARLVIVGDVHGCKDELVKLLDELSFRPANDHLILTGDIIAKGPDSGGVVDLAQEMKASVVRGNHEDRILLAHREIHSKQLPLQGPEEDPQRPQDDMEEESFSHGDYKDRAMARKLTDKQVAFLKDSPVILDVGTIDGMGNVVVVHAGLVPGVKLEEQDPYSVMNMRTIDLETHVPSESREGTEWYKLWNHHQFRLPKGNRTTVVYGHDSKTGLNIEKYSKGLDSGCVRGGELTALVIEGGKNSAKQHLVSVQCRDYRPKMTEEEKMKEVLKDGQP